MRLSDLVATYITIRDRRANRKRAFLIEDEADKTRQEKIEAVFLMKFKELGIDSVKAANGAGTAYKALQTSATVADRSVFLEHVVSNSAFELLDVKANKTSVAEYKAANDGAIPPGLNWREEQTINVRR